MSGLKILKAGPLTLVQDSGRKNQMHSGISQGGACDTHAFFWANHLLSNEKNSAALEITFGPFEAEFLQASLISISGADLNCTINNKPVNNWSSHKIQAGDVIRMSPGNNGIRAYLGIKGGLQTKHYFGSRSEIPRENLFPLQTTRGAVLPFNETNPEKYRLTFTPERFLPDYRDELSLRILPAYQYEQFDQEALIRFVNHHYCISKSSDRMGYRLSGEEISWGHGNIISEGIALGSVQIPPDGQPIVLLNDRQSVGGYPKIGCVCQKDCAQLSQRQTGQKIYFEFVDIDSLTPAQGNANYLHPVYY